MNHTFLNNSVLDDGGGDIDDDSDDLSSEWLNLGTMVQLDTPVCSLSVDPFDELLWLGHANGRVTSYSYPDGERYSSFRSFDETMDVKQLLIQQDNVMSLSSSSFHVHSKGGIPQWSYSHPDFNDQLLAFSGVSTYQKATTFSAYGAVNYPSFQRVVLGGTINSLFSVDLKQGQLVDSVDISQGVCVLKPAGRFIASGGINGELALRDPRTLSLEHSFDVHTGSVSDLEVKGDLLVTCGFANRYGEYFVDTVVKAFDMRTMRMLGQIHFPAGPAFLRFHPMFSSLLAIVSQSGYIQYRDVQSEVTTSPGIEYSSSDNTLYSVETQGEVIETFGLSSSGEVMMFGDSGGKVHVFAQRSKQEHGHNTSCLNLHPVIRDEDPDMPDGLNLLSDWPSSYTTLCGQHPPEIHPQIYANLHTVTDPESGSTYGIALNPGLRRPQDGYLERKTFMNYMTVDRKASSKRNGELNVIPRDYDHIEVNLVLKNRGYKEFNYNKYNKTNMIGLDNQLEHCNYVNSFIQVMYHLNKDLKTAVMNHTCDRPVCLACELGFLFYMMDQIHKYQSVEDIRTAIPGNFLRALKRLYAENVLPSMNDSSLSAGQRAIIFNQFIWSHLHEELKNDVYQCALSFPSTVMLSSKHPAMTNLNLSGITTVTNNQTNRRNGSHKTKSYRSRGIIDAMFGSAVANVDPDTNSYTEGYQIVFNHSLQLSGSTTNTTFGEIVMNALNLDHLSKPKTLTNMPNILNLNFNMSQDDIRWLRMQHIRRSSFDPNDEQHFKANSRVSLPAKFTVRTSGDDDVIWKVEDVTYDLADGTPGAKRKANKKKDPDNRHITYVLRAVIVEIKHPYKHQHSDDRNHCVSFVRIPNDKHELEWYLFNDFNITRHESAFDFSQSWKTPCILFYVREDSERILSKSVEFKNPINPDIVFRDDFMAIKREHNNISEESINHATEKRIPSQGDILSIDAEFVVLETEKLKHQKTVSEQEDSRATIREYIAQPMFSLGRVSVILDKTYETFIDDFIATQSEVVHDYMTRYSGLKKGDLDIETSTHHITHLKATYMKLRALVDRGVIFVGHGLQNDFRTINIHVPRSQIIDTVELFQLPRQRKISLRFLANFLLHSDIQQETHCSIEDAQTALKVYHRYLEYVEKGEFEQLLNEVYTVGRNSNWQISENLPNHQSGEISGSLDTTTNTDQNLPTNSL